MTLERLKTGTGLSGDPATTFARSVLEALDDHHEANEPDLVQDLFKRRSRQAERFVAGCLLRLLAEAPELFDDPRFGNRAQDLLDKALPDVYKEVGLKARQQTYEKRLELRELIPRYEATLAEQISKLHVPEGSALRARREPLLRTIGRLTKVLRDTLPAAVEGDVSAYVDAAASVIEAPPEGRLAREKEFDTRSAAFSDAYGRYGTRHAADLGRRLVDVLTSVVDAHRDAHPLRPAELSLRPAVKKYPLREHGRSFRARLVIDNSADCSAAGVQCEITATAGIVVPSPIVYLGAVEPGTTEIELDARTDPPDLIGDDGEIIGVLTWSNPDGTTGNHEFDCRLTGQRRELDWAAAADRSPYSLAPLSDPEQLIGRGLMLHTLEAGIAGEDSLSFLITGQKRVGKTSLVQVLAARLVNQRVALPAYVQVGTYADDPEGLVKSIVRAIRSGLRTHQGSDAAVAVASAWLRDHSAPKVSELFDVVEDLLASGLPARKLLIVLDEFDELPSGLYRQSDEARAFFNTLRGLMTLRDVSVILVGGERTNYVLASHGQALNLLKQQRLDVFSRQDQLQDFADLVRHPTAGLLDFTDQAVATLAALTGGHPFYARMLCGDLHREMVERRDSSVTPREITAAAALTLDTAAMTNFAHYWEDGILEVEPGRRQEIRQQRVRLLVALSRAMTKQGYAPLDVTESQARRAGLDSALLHQTLASFEQRRIIEYDRDAQTLRPAPPIFGRWLSEHGVAEMITAVPDETESVRAEQQRAEARVSAGEIRVLVQTWPTYRGRAVESEQVRAWLEQFGDEIDQRRAFTVLRAVEFVSDGRIRTAFREIHRSIVAGRVREPVTRAKFRDVLVVSPDPPGKSGQVYARLYAQETSTHQGNICDLRQLPHRLAGTKSAISSVVVVNDFIGTGQNMCERLGDVAPSVFEMMGERSIEGSIVVYAATADGLQTVEGWLDAQGLAWTVRNHLTLGPDARVFSAQADVFDSAAERESTKALFAAVGSQLVDNAPLGFGDSELGLVFENSIPNNSLPALWSRSARWEPLFARL